MALFACDAYNQIEHLENTNQITLPEPTEVVRVGDVDMAHGTFSRPVPTYVRTTVIPPIPPAKTNPFTYVTRGLVTASAVNLVFKFDIYGAPPLTPPTHVIRREARRLLTSRRMTETPGGRPRQKQAPDTSTGNPSQLND